MARTKKTRKNKDLKTNVAPKTATSTGKNKPSRQEKPARKTRSKRQEKPAREPRKETPRSVPGTPETMKRAILGFLRRNGQKAYRPKEIARHLGVKEQEAYALFQETLTHLAEQRLVARRKGNRYAYRPQPKKLVGTLSVHPRGFGFVTVEGEADDYYVPANRMGTALDGDRVRIGLAAHRRGDQRHEAEVLEVLERRRTRTVGTFLKKGHFALVRPDDTRIVHDIYVPREAFHGARNGDKVVVSIDLFDDPHARPEGRVLQVIGRADDPAVRVLALALSMDVKAEFPEQVLAEADALRAEIPRAERSRRLDLRHKRIFTIDPVDAKDFDDAIHIEKLDNGHYEVGVHIADVSHYVRPGTALDEEALARSTSVYLVDRVIPMLPEKLSNVVCSLRPHEDKLTFSCIMEVTPRGKVVRYQIRETIIHSKQRFTYEEAQAIIEGKNQRHPFAADVRRANKLARTLTRKRMASGSIDFDLPEVRVVLDEQGHPVEIIRKERMDANRLIEEFMLLANRTVAEHIGMRKNPKPFVYRVHDQPDEEKMRQLADYIRAFGYRLDLKDGRVDPKQLNDLLQAVKGTPQEPVIEEAALRAMAKARYDTNNIGHFGLGFKHYTHFTSPIRRYPDLMVHRLLKAYATGQKNADVDDLQARCEHASERERAAVQAERESVKLKQVEFIANHVGETFDGVVSGVTSFGIFVELTDLLVEGMVHVRDLDDDFYEYDERNYRLVGLSSGRTFRLGDAVRVTVAAANLETREIDFVLAE
ncbi:MAG: ribonuclease R [Rhodothermaceae bacterium]|nr:MAG: ribonuclease R [Rhodothermaceae bacterium]